MVSRIHLSDGFTNSDVNKDDKWSDWKDSYEF